MRIPRTAAARASSRHWRKSHGRWARRRPPTNSRSGCARPAVAIRHTPPFSKGSRVDPIVALKDRKFYRVREAEDVEDGGRILAAELVQASSCRNPRLPGRLIGRIPGIYATKLEFATG